MTIGPIVITISRSKTIERALATAYEAQAKAQRIDMRQDRVIAGLTKDNYAMRHTLEKIIEGMGSRTGKTPSGVGQTV